MFLRTRSNFFKNIYKSFQKIYRYFKKKINECFQGHAEIFSKGYTKTFKRCTKIFKLYIAVFQGIHKCF